MPKSNTLSEATPVLIGCFFLMVPVALLLTGAAKHFLPIEDSSTVMAATLEGNLSEDYAMAVRSAMQPDPSYISHSLIPVDATQPLTVVTWTEGKWVPGFKKGATDRNTWVTVAPSLRSFCQDYVRSHGADLNQLNLRLEQRLGLAPGGNYDTFVELKLEPKELSNTSKFFRPCGDSSTSSKTCSPASPPKPEEIKPDLQPLDPGNPKQVGEYWLLSNYYQSFSSSHQYPWTTLGYTFDWARREDASEDFVRWGESEFVISPQTPFQFVFAADTAAYCAPQ